MRKVEDIEQCTIHPLKQAQGQCCICSGYFCEDCLAQEGSLVFCLDHHRAFLEKKWAPLKKVISSAETPEAGIELYELKDRLWRDQGIFCYIETNYALAQDSDVIQSYVTLYVEEMKK